MKRVATFTLTGSYQRLSVLAAAFAGQPLRNATIFRNGAFRCAKASTDDVRIAIVPDGIAAADTSSILLDQGEYLAFTETNLTEIWAKAAASSGTLELEGDTEW